MQLECKVNEVVELGDQGGAGNLIICEVVMVHVDDEVLTDDHKIDPVKIDTVAAWGATGIAVQKTPCLKYPSLYAP
jgi:hypothetical protein